MVYKTVKYAAKKYPAIRKRANVYIPAVRQLASDVMYLKGLVNSEPKQFGLATSGNFDYTGTVVSLCNIVTGDTSYNRDGNRVLPRYLNIKFHCNRGITAPTYTHTTIRYVLFRWWGESPNAVGVAPVPSDILESTSTQFAPLGHLKTDIVGSRGDRNRRIEVHRSGFMTLDSVSKTSIDCDFNIQLNGGTKPKEHMEYYDNTTAPPTSGGFFILFINDNPTSADAAFYLRSVITFYDN